MFCFVWVCDFNCHLREEHESGDVWEQDVEKNVGN